MVTMKGTRPHFLLKVTPIKMALTIRRPSLQCQRMTLLRIILTLVAHYDLEFHQMDVKTAILNGDIEEKVYMDLPEEFLAT